MYSQLKRHTAKIEIYIEGVCASAATLIAMAGDTVKMTKNSLFMVHNPLTNLYGSYNADDLSKRISVLETIKETIITTYMDKTGKTKEELSEILNNETWFTADEAIINGFIDEIEENESIDFFIDEDSVYVNKLEIKPTGFKNFPTQFYNKFKNRAEKPFFNTQKTKQEVEKMTLNELQERFPELVDQIKQDTVKTERERLKAIDEIADSIPQNLVQKAKYVDFSTAEQLAFNVVKANGKKATQVFNDIQADSSDSGVSSVKENAFSAESGKENKISNLVKFLNKGGK